LRFETGLYIVVLILSGEISLTCDKCGEGFRRTSELNRHLKTKHDDDDCVVPETISANVLIGRVGVDWYLALLEI
jgi:hypothetical protein